jgi:hypothetical protein
MWHCLVRNSNYEGPPYSTLGQSLVRCSISVPDHTHSSCSQTSSTNVLLALRQRELIPSRSFPRKAIYPGIMVLEHRNELFYSFWKIEVTGKKTIGTPI